MKFNRIEGYCSYTYCSEIALVFEFWGSCVHTCSWEELPSSLRFFKKLLRTFSVWLEYSVLVAALVGAKPPSGESSAVPFLLLDDEFANWALLRFSYDDSSTVLLPICNDEGEIIPWLADRVELEFIPSLSITPVATCWKLEFKVRNNKNKPSCWINNEKRRQHQHILKIVTVSDAAH